MSKSVAAAAAFLGCVALAIGAPGLFEAWQGQIALTVTLFILAFRSF